ncbi:MAG: MBL fold metallo-hydrolase, partial [Candidatus Bathyarchaeota archaeon]
KVGHHGSQTSTSQLFLDTVEPSYAIVSAGVDNTYGHPHNETIQKLLAKEVTIYGTYVSER